MPGYPGAMQRQVEAIRARLDRVEEGLREARAATEVLLDGDATALAELDGVVDAMAVEIAELKSQTAGTRF